MDKTLNRRRPIKLQELTVASREQLLVITVQRQIIWVAETTRQSVAGHSWHEWSWSPTASLSVIMRPSAIYNPWQQTKPWLIFGARRNLYMTTAGRCLCRCLCHRGDQPGTAGWMDVRRWNSAECYALRVVSTIQLSTTSKSEKESSYHPYIRLQEPPADSWTVQRTVRCSNPSDTWSEYVQYQC